MNIQRISVMPSISEESAAWESSSQEARKDGSWHNSDVAMHSIHAARLENSLRNSQQAENTRPAVPQQTTQPNERCKTWKTFCHITSMACGIAILPSFALLALGPLGLLAPAFLMVGFITLALLGGKPPKAIQTTLDRRAVELANCDNRAMT